MAVSGAERQKRYLAKRKKEFDAMCRELAVLRKLVKQTKKRTIKPKMTARQGSEE